MLLSMRHILKLAKSLERHGIYENSLIMKGYVAIWFGAWTTMLIDLIMLIKSRDELLPEETQVKYKIAFEAFSLINFFFLFALDLMVLITYLRFSFRLDNAAVQQCTQTLQVEMINETSCGGSVNGDDDDTDLAR